MRRSSTTRRSASEDGYEVRTLTDGVACTSIEAHENAITYDDPMFSEPTTANEFIADLG